MQKISSLFIRTGIPYLAIPYYHEDALWVAAGLGIATQKFDGTCCAVFDHELYCRRHKKFIKVEEGDVNCKWHRQWSAENPSALRTLENGTYELCGPGVQGNPEDYPFLRLRRHGEVTFDDAPRTFVLLREWLSSRDIEGLVWHGPGGRMIKIKKSDFGLPRMP